MAGDAGLPGALSTNNIGQPPNPPAAAAGTLGSGTPSQALASPPASGGPFNYWQSQPSPMMGRGFNAAGFGGLGATGGQGPGARYWSRLNNIGGS